MKGAPQFEVHLSKPVIGYSRDRFVFAQSHTLIAKNQVRVSLYEDFEVVGQLLPGVHSEEVMLELQVAEWIGGS